MQRYIFAIEIPIEIQKIIHDVCQRLTGNQSPVRFHHITIVPPFFLKNETSLSVLQKQISLFSFDSFHAHLSTLETFTQHNRNIVVALVEPQTILENISNAVKRIVEPFIETDRTPYSAGKVPAFQAHVTIDYNAPKSVVEQLSSIPLPKQEWNVATVELYMEVEQGAWRLVPFDHS